jgi:NAD(P)-dependent dehydrogenase (short-subunit alcohol dehydrogenase family)
MQPLWHGLGMKSNLHEKPRALITGAAKRVGREIALHLASRGYDVVLHCHRSLQEAEQLATQLQALGARVHVLRADLNNLAALEHFFDGVPPCSLLIHNASVFLRDDANNMNAETLEAQFRVNTLAPFLLSQKFFMQLPEQAHGNVICLSDSTMGWSISPYFLSYAASKQALDALTDLMATSFAPRVRVNTIALGPTLVSANENVEMFARLAEKSPLGTTSSVADVLSSIDYVLETKSVTGQILCLSSGLQARTKRIFSDG